jgi:phosphotransferase family enzyme
MPAYQQPDATTQLLAIDGLTTDQVIRRTDKTLLAAGTYRGQAVVVKLLLDDDDEWATRWRHEIAAYQQFAQDPPPVHVPALAYTDDRRVMVLERIEGRVLDPDRYPTVQPNPGEMEAVLEAIRQLNRWRSGIEDFPSMDYRARTARYHAAGYLTDADRTVLERLLAECGAATEFGHGDPLPSNILVEPGNRIALLDWEFAGLFLPGFDLAMLHTLLSAHPAAQRTIATLVEDLGIRRPFLVNRITVLSRELRIHRELPAEAPHRQRLELLDTAWQAARRELHNFIEE